MGERRRGNERRGEGEQRRKGREGGTRAGEGGREKGEDGEETEKGAVAPALDGRLRPCIGERRCASHGCADALPRLRRRATSPSPSRYLACAVPLVPRTPPAFCRRDSPLARPSYRRDHRHPASIPPPPTRIGGPLRSRSIAWRRDEVHRMAKRRGPSHGDETRSIARRRDSPPPSPLAWEEGGLTRRRRR